MIIKIDDAFSMLIDTDDAFSMLIDTDDAFSNWDKQIKMTRKMIKLHLHISHFYSARDIY